uniref:Uncharacterized protein n=1 Tax=Phlebotomus papatasi TaxID=29031 RepID=A0A1B0DHL0_PHLPP
MALVRRKLCTKIICRFFYRLSSCKNCRLWESSILLLLCCELMFSYFLSISTFVLGTVKWISETNTTTT